MSDEIKEIKVYGAEWCAYCNSAKTLLEEKGVEFTYIDIDKVPKDEIISSFKSIPQVYMNNEHIGGYAELQQVICGG